MLIIPGHALGPEYGPAVHHVEQSFAVASSMTSEVEILDIDAGSVHEDRIAATMLSLGVQRGSCLALLACFGTGHHDLGASVSLLYPTYGAINPLCKKMHACMERKLEQKTRRDAPDGLVRRQTRFLAISIIATPEAINPEGQRNTLFTGHQRCLRDPGHSLSTCSFFIANNAKYLCAHSNSGCTGPHYPRQKGTSMA